MGPGEAAEVRDIGVDPGETAPLRERRQGVGSRKHRQDTPMKYPAQNINELQNRLALAML